MMGNNYKGPLDYIDVATRIAEFRKEHPEGRLSSIAPDGVLVRPYTEVIGGKTFLVYCAFAYDSAEDMSPGVGWAWEPVPGATSFTRDSELQNAETAAWGRALVAKLRADTKKGIASSEEVRNRQEPQSQPVNAQQSKEWWETQLVNAKTLEATRKLYNEAKRAGTPEDFLNKVLAAGTALKGDTPSE